MNRQRGPAGWRYRCYKFFPYEKGWKATNLIPALSPDLPWKFVWRIAEDREGLHSYVDALLTGSRARSSEYEDKGFVTDIETYQFNRPDDVRIRVNIKTLVDVMALRDHFDVPLWGKVQFLTDGEKLIPREFIAALAQISPEHSDVFDTNRRWDYAPDKKIEAMGLTSKDVTSSMNLQKVPVAEIGKPRVTFTRRNYGAAPQEIRVSLKHFDGYFQLVTQVRPDGETPFYTQRIARPDGSLLWCGTSYSTDGPWTVYHRDAAELLALGIEL